MQPNPPGTDIFTTLHEKRERHKFLRGIARNESKSPFAEASAVPFIAVLPPPSTNANDNDNENENENENQKVKEKEQEQEQKQKQDHEKEQEKERKQEGSVKEASENAKVVVAPESDKLEPGMGKRKEAFLDIINKNQPEGKLSRSSSEKKRAPSTPSLITPSLLDRYMNGDEGDRLDLSYLLEQTKQYIYVFCKLSECILQFP